MDFQTKVELPAGLPPVSHAERILLMGSCFAENMGRLLAENKFRVDMNPFGILYNPLSVSTALVEILKGKVYQEKDLFLYKECWHSPMHHGLFSASSPEEVLEKINTRLSQAHRSVHELDWLMLTFGTAYVYEQKETRQVVSNCHKLPESCFNRRILSVDEIVNEYTSLITSMVARNSHLKVLFTVSPIRHIRDGMHANQLSKSTLLLAIDRLQQLFPDHVFYFPSYEIVMDELRDYRFYDAGMTHPNEQAIRYIWERFSEACFSEETQTLNREWERLEKALNHRPLTPDKDAFRDFTMQNLFKLKKIWEKYSNYDLSKEIESQE